MEIQKTRIPCFECGWHSGIDCPGRKPDEATRCVLCLEKFMQANKNMDITYEKSIRQQSSNQEDRSEGAV